MMRSSSRRRLGWRSPLTLLIALLLALGLLAGCGGDGDSDTTTAGTEQTAATTDTEPGSTDSSAQTESNESAESDADAEAPAGPDTADGDANFGNEGPMVVPPNRHKDSGGGSKQFRTKGGDNSIQDFGKEAQGDEFSTTAAIAHAFLDARAADDAAEACKYLASHIIDEMKQFAAQEPDAPGDCAGLVEMFTGGMDPKVRRSIAKADIASVRSDGEAAFVLYRGARNQVFLLPMAVENGQWMVAAIAASPLP